MNTFHPLRMVRIVRHATHLPPLRAHAAAACRRIVLQLGCALALVLAAGSALAQNISTVAGDGGTGFSGDGGPATAAQLRWPDVVALDAVGNLYIVASGSQRVRKVDGAGTISTVAGTNAGFSGDGGPAIAAQLYNPYDAAVDAAGNLHISDTTNSRIRKVDSAGDISTVAGAGGVGFSGDGGQATAAALDSPSGVAVDAAGSLYILDRGNHRIRKVDSTGVISTVAGTGVRGFSGDGGQASAATLDSPSGVAVDAAGNLYIADTNNGRIRKVDSTGVISTVAGTGGRGFSGDGGQASAATLDGPSGIAVDAAGNLYIADTNNGRIRKVADAPPGAPTAATALAGDAQAAVSWSAPSNTGGRPITSYTATAVQDNTKTCTPAPATATTCTVAGLANGSAYTFTVVASNSVGPGPASTASAPATPVGLPSAPTAVTAVAGDASAKVSWTAPASNGGSAITSYTATAVQDNTKTCTPAPATATTCTVAGLANGTGYTFTVVASSIVGPGTASAPSAPATPAAAPDPGPGNLPVSTPGTTTTITDPGLPILINPGAVGGTLVLPGTGTTPVTLQVSINGQPLTVRALPGTQLRIAQVDGQSVLVLVVLQGWASMTSSAVGQPLVLAGPVLLRSGHANTGVEAIPLVVAVQVGSLLPPAGGSLPQVGSMGLQAGERLQVNEQGAVVSITLGSLRGDTSQPGDAMAFANLPASIITVDKAFARLAGPLARLSGVNLAQSLETAASGVLLVRSGGQVFQLLPTLPISIDATLPDGLGFTPLGLLRWVRGGVVVQFAPAVADLAGLASAVNAALPGAQIQLGAEGVLQLRAGGQGYVLKPDWTGAGTAAGTPRIGVDSQGRISLQIGNGPAQLLLPALLSATQAQAIFQAAMPGAALALQPASNEGAFTLTLAGQAWRLVPQWVLPGAGAAAQGSVPSANWWIGGDGLLYLKLGTQVQGMRLAD